jgi:hypothetical protein
MTTRTLTIGVAAMSLAASTSAVLARPPTVLNSPGYQARLAESRKAWANYEYQLQQGQPAVRPLRQPRHILAQPKPR